jgi:aspartate aminotransferase-like enzyme
VGVNIIQEMTREEKLKEEGWEKRFTMEEPRLSEMAEQYRELGFEVFLEPVDTSSEECTTCLKNPAYSQLYKTIYTRQRRKGDFSG